MCKSILLSHSYLPVNHYSMLRHETNSNMLLKQEYRPTVSAPVCVQYVHGQNKRFVLTSGSICALCAQFQLSIPSISARLRAPVKCCGDSACPHQKLYTRLLSLLLRLGGAGTRLRRHLWPRLRLLCRSLLAPGRSLI